MNAVTVALSWIENGENMSATIGDRPLRIFIKVIRRIKITGG